MSTFTHIHYHKVDKYQNQYAVLTLNRPQKAHAYNRAMLCEIEAHLHEIQKKTNICALVIQSEGHRVFCAGADLEEMKTATALTALHLQSEAVFSLLENLSCVTIASVHGPAIAGGFEMTLACWHVKILLSVFGPQVCCKGSLSAHRTGIFDDAYW